MLIYVTEKTRKTYTKTSSVFSVLTTTRIKRCGEVDLNNQRGGYLLRKCILYLDIHMEKSMVIFVFRLIDSIEKLLGCLQHFEGKPLTRKIVSPEPLTFTSKISSEMVENGTWEAIDKKLIINPPF
jgi:hypothetical protein